MGLGQPYTIAMVLLGLGVLLGSGLPLLADAVGRAWHLSINCNTLTFLGAVGAYVLGIREVVQGGEARHAALLFEASAAVVTFALLTQLLQRRSYDQLRLGVQRVLRTRPELVERVFEAQVTKGQRQIMMDALVRVGLPATAAVAFLVVFVRAGLGLDVLGVVIPAVALVAAAAPHAVGVSVAMASMAGMLRAAERKVLFRDVENMEMLAEMTALVTTKSVVAQGTPRVQEAEFFAGNRRDILAMVAAAEAGSIQPAGRALYDFAVAQGIRPAQIEEVEFLHGYGLAARIGTRRVVIGSRALMEREEIDMAPAASAETKVAAGGKSVAFVAVDRELAGMFALADRARPGITQIVAALKRLGVHTTLLTGDPPRAAQAMAREAGMEGVLAEIPPDRRALELTDSRGPDEVLAVGGHPEKDGDLLQVGDVSIGVTEAPIPRVAAGVWLMRGTFADLLPAIEVARHARVVSRQNAALAVVWTAVVMALGALGILGSHGPCIAGGASALLSSVLAASTRRLLGRQPKAVR
jgi:Cu+-exporting ATPase